MKDLFERNMRPVARRAVDPEASYAKACDYALIGMQLFCASAAAPATFHAEECVNAQAGPDGGCCECDTVDATNAVIDVTNEAMDLGAAFVVCAFICWTGSL